jgi:hypothetical protein
MTKTLTFAHTLRYGQPVATGSGRTGVGTRPYVWFKIFNPTTGAASRRAFALIDSGCDECFLDDGLLAGLRLSTAKSSVTVAGGGNANAEIAQGAEIEIEGIRVSGRPLTFGNTTTSLIGRDIYLRAFELAFTGKDWHHA